MSEFPGNLSVCFSLYKRIKGQEDVRSVALAKRTFQRAKLKIDQIASSYSLSDGEYRLFEEIVQMQEAKTFSHEEFVKVFEQLCKGCLK